MNASVTRWKEGYGDLLDLRIREVQELSEEGTVCLRYHFFLNSFRVESEGLWAVS
jgi:hypothetical protein